MTVTGAAEQDARLVLAVPAGTSHDPWNANRALRVMQPAADVDLDVQARWATVPSLKYQMQGIVIEQDERNWLRFDVYSTGSALRVFAAKTVDGRSSALMATSVPAGSVAGLEVVRTGSTWSVSYDSGSGWTSIGSVTHALAVTAIGPFAGTAGTLPAWSSELDWFFDATSPIDPEDGATPAQYLLSTSVVGSGSVERSPDAASYASGSVVELTAVPAPGWQFAGWSGDAAGSDPVTSVTMVADVSVTATFTEAPAAVPPTGGPVSDDFSSGSLVGTWEVVDPAGGGTVAFAGLGTDDAHLELSVPEGTSYDPWNANRSLRVMQGVADVDFQVAARFTSSPSLKYQQQGFMVEQDPGNWLRFDVYSNGSTWYVLGARTVDGSSSKLFSRAVTPSPEVTLRLTRVGGTWTLEYSPDGQTWSTGGTATHALTVGAVGVFAGNGGTKPAFTASVDWFFDTANPIDPEDGSVADAYPLTTTVTGQGAVTRAPPAGSYPAGTVVSLTAEPAAGWQLSHWTGDVSGTEPVVEVTMDGPKDVGVVFTELPPDPPAIDIWYGDEQVFGRNGQSQRWVNVLGNAGDEDGVSSLSYTVNGGSPRPLRMGPDLRRLYGTGDFNVEIPYDELLDGPNAVVLTATDAVGDTSTRTVTVVKDVRAGDRSRVVDWSTAAQPDDVAQVVDGKWSTGPDGLTVNEM
ncbi:MAG: InlB B-repeat-containing protein, partial [Actinomycetota bacterium]